MDVINVVETVDEVVWDWDITYLGGVIHQHTLRPARGQSMKETTAHLVFYLGSERVVCERKNILTFSVRERIMRTPLTAELPKCQNPDTLGRILY